MDVRLITRQSSSLWNIIHIHSRSLTKLITMLSLSTNNNVNGLNGKVNGRHVGFENVSSEWREK